LSDGGLKSGKLVLLENTKKPEWRVQCRGGGSGGETGIMDPENWTEE